MTEAATLPTARTCPFAPPDEHIRLREQAPVSRVTLPNGTTVWAFTRHEDVRTMLTDHRFSSDRGDPNFPDLFSPQASAEPRKPNPGGASAASLLGMDRPEHTAARRAVVGEFTVKRMAALRPRVQQIVDERIDAMLAGPQPADLVQALALPVPSLVICELLGVPYSDHEFFQSRSAKLVDRTSSPEEVGQALGAIVDYMRELIARKETEPGDDLLSRQLAKGSDREELANLGFLLLSAGHETTANMISLGTVALLEHPESLAMLRADPAKTPDAVEELLRYFAIAEFATARVLKDDVEVGGERLRTGDGAIALTNTANRDPEAFGGDADALDLRRGARHHITFGYGAHQCLGQNLARLELQVVFDTLFARLPDLRLAAPVEELPFKNNTAVYGLYELPVTW